MASTAESSQADPAGPTTPRVAEFELARPIASDEAIQSAHNHHNTHNHYYPTTAASYAPRRTPRRAVQRDGHGESMLMDSVETRRSTSGRPASRGAAVPLMAEISSSSLAWPAASHLSSRGGGHSSRDSSRRSGMVAFSTVSHSHATTPTSSARREAHDGSHPSRRVVPPPPPLLAADAWIASAPPQQLDASALAPLSSWCSATQQQPPPPPGWMDALRGEAEKLPREELLELVEQGRLDVRVRRANVERQRATLEALHAGVRQNVVSADHNQEEITNGLLRRIDVVQRHKKSLHKRLNAQLRERAKLEVKLASTTAAIAEMHSHLREEEGGPTQQRMEEQLGYLTDQRQQLETILEEHTLSLQELEHLVKEAQDKGGLGGGGSGSFDSTSSSLAATPTVPVCAPLPSVVPPPPPPPLDTHGREAMADYLSQAITMVEALQEEAMERSAAYANKKVELEQRVLECEHTMATRHQDVELMSQELREVNQAAVYRATTREQELELRVEALVHGGRGGLALAHSLSQTGSTSNLSTPKLRGQHMPPPQQGSPATATLLLDDESTVSTTISRSLYSPNSNAGGGGRLSRCASATASSGGRRPPAHPSLVREIAPPLALPHAALSSTRATDSHTHLLPGEGRASPALAIPSPQPRSGSQMSVQETRRMSAPRPLSSAECTPKRSPRMRAPERRSISPME